MNRLGQFRVLRGAIRNWPLAAVDRAGLRKHVRYRARRGTVIWCRARTSDLAEAALVLGGSEYPRELLTLPDQGTVVDLGANIGAFALLVHEVNRGVSYRGIAFEPFLENRELLERNLAANYIEQFTVVEAACSGTDGTVMLRTDVPPDRVHISAVGTVPAASVKLSTYCREHDLQEIDLLKVDIEGGEYDLVRSDLAFVEASVKSMLIEFHDLDASRHHDRLISELSGRFDVRVLHSRGLSGIVHAQKATS
jgi:FkbM family methyltransferase